jgi:hypothetical protein
MGISFTGISRSQLVSRTAGAREEPANDNVENKIKNNVITRSVT